ncbi:MAG: hypothetical protein JWO03_1173 [Bacteroidetes bacterium]|nr:hypothetical protein [Bacteroidota bacterium]
MKKKPFILYALLGLLLFQGIGAMGGGGALMIRPDGSILHMPLSPLAESVFPNYLIPGLILFFILGVFPVFTFYLLLRQPQWHFLGALNIYSDRYVGWMFSLFIGISLIIWMYVELVEIGYGSIVQTIYFVLGLLILILTLTPGVMKYYERKISS